MTTLPDRLADHLDGLARAARAELTGHILPYWSGRMVDAEHGGFRGRIDGTDRVVPGAPKGAVLNARMLWTFAVAAREPGPAGDACRALADRAYGYLHAYFRDETHGGVYWTLTAEGHPLRTKKQVYAQAFAVYALAEYAALTGLAEPLAWAQSLVALLEQHAADPVYDGYVEAFAADWGPLADVRLSDKDADAPKSMNTHLHVMEAYAALYRIAPDAALGARVRALVELFLDRIVAPDGQSLTGFFAIDWTPLSDTVSFGHDIEAAWLLDEAAEILSDDALTARVRRVTVPLARAVLTHGVDADGGLFNEATPAGLSDTDKHWWPQAEAVVGFLNAYRQTDDPVFAHAALKTWAFIERAVIDPAGGEWFFRVARDGAPYRDEDKAGPWKCPYHTARACVEISHRVAALQTAATPA